MRLIGGCAANGVALRPRVFASSPSANLRNAAALRRGRVGTKARGFDGAADKFSAA